MLNTGYWRRWITKKFKMIHLPSAKLLSASRCVSQIDKYQINIKSALHGSPHLRTPKWAWADPFVKEFCGFRSVIGFLQRFHIPLLHGNSPKIEDPCTGPS